MTRVMDLWWDVYNGPTTTVPTTLLNQTGAKPTSSQFWTGGSGWSSHPPYIAALGRDVMALGSATARAGTSSQFTFPLVHDKALVVNKVSESVQLVCFDIEMCASQAITDNSAGVDGNAVGLVFEQSDGGGIYGAINGALTFDGAIMGLVAAADGNWYFFGGTKSRPGTTTFPMDCCSDQLIAGTNTALHKFRFLFRSATSTAYGSLNIYVDDSATPALTIDWDTSSTPRLPGYGSGVFPWWRIWLAGDKATGGLNGGAELYVATAHFFTGPDDGGTV